MNHQIHSLVANSTSSGPHHGPRCRIISVLGRPIADSARAFVAVSPAADQGLDVCLREPLRVSNRYVSHGAVALCTSRSAGASSRSQIACPSTYRASFGFNELETSNLRSSSRRSRAQRLRRRLPARSPRTGSPRPRRGSAAAPRSRVRPDPPADSPRPPRVSWSSTTWPHPEQSLNGSAQPPLACLRL